MFFSSSSERSSNVTRSLSSAALLTSATSTFFSRFSFRTVPSSSTTERTSSSSLLCPSFLSFAIFFFRDASLEVASFAAFRNVALSTSHRLLSSSKFDRSVWRLMISVEREETRAESEEGTEASGATCSSIVGVGEGAESTSFRSDSLDFIFSKTLRPPTTTIPPASAPIPPPLAPPMRSPPITFAGIESRNCDDGVGVGEPPSSLREASDSAAASTAPLYTSPSKNAH
mmetsp:Transcript_16525/g.34101  ORF Transcript_16525/g.34101 Transcript_16525/m.34101 type:complete len:229 (-) Transcript_16525:771-1457(-)